MLLCRSCKTLSGFAATLSVVIIIIIFVYWSPWKSDSFGQIKEERKVLHLVKFKPNFNDSYWKENCYFHTCFEINDCQYELHERIKIYIYPEYTYSSPVHLEISTEYQEIINTIKNSHYYEPLPFKACLFVPSIDTLNQRNLNLPLTSSILHSLPWWTDGENHIIFSMLPGQFPFYNTTPDFSYGRAVLAGGSFTAVSYRIGFDIALPVYNSLTRKDIYISGHHDNNVRKHMLSVLVQLGSDPLAVYTLKSVHQSTNDGVILLGSCEHCHDCTVERRCDLVEEGVHWSYPDVLRESVFCLILPGYRLGTPDLLDVLMTGCIPVIVQNPQYILPFSEVLDWTRASIKIWTEELPDILTILQTLGVQVVQEKQAQVQYLYRRYFFSIPTITMTTLHILNGRVFPMSAPTYEWWNNPDFNPQQTNYFQHSYSHGLTLPSSPSSEGFTAVILTYDRIDMLFETIRSVAQAPSLAKVLVIWNNIYKSPPSVKEWPNIKKPIQVIRSKQNKLSNRFYPYSEIETAAILSLDDDITMLSGDEIEFGYKAWLEYPNCLVGYPGRVHWYDSKTHNWKYDSEWTNNISVVLTGAAFYHKYYHYLYTYQLPKSVREWVDDHFNCEDIVFNFMVANATGLAPIKVTPRKRFKCADCTQDGLFADPSHFLERDQCINLFAKVFQGVPLKASKFRLDPVLYKINSVPEKEKAFPKIGEL